MVALVFFALPVTVVAVLVALWHGTAALNLADGHTEASSLKLIALNLLEPVVTILIVIVSALVFKQVHPKITDVAGNIITDTVGDILTLLPPALPLTLMLLTPLFVRVQPPLRSTLIAYGLLRWTNTIALWGINLMRIWELQTPKPNGGNGPHPWLDTLETIEGTLILSGTLILCLSVAHLASSLSDFRAPSPPIAATDSPRA